MEDNNQQSRGWYDANAVRDAARGKWMDVLGAMGVRTELLNARHGPCPGCGGKDRFRFDDKDGEGTFICSQGGGDVLSGDGITLLMHVTQWEWKRCIEEVGRLLLPDAVRSTRPRRVLEDGVAPPPRLEPLPKKRPYDLRKLETFVQGTPEIDRSWVRARSKLPVEHVTSADFIEALYRTDERVLAFTNYYSQGEFIHWVGKESFRLSEHRNVRAAPSKLPTTSREGVWYLTNPVTGAWEFGGMKPVYEKLPDGSQMKVGEEAHYTRRSWRTVTSWRYLTIESDDAPEELWIRALVKLALPIAAVYSSGGRSLHALVRLDCDSKNEMDAVRDVVRLLLSPIGADPANMSAVRLSRLPGCLREGKVDKQGRYKAFPKPLPQELIYLNPDPPMKPILALKARAVQV